MQALSFCEPSARTELALRDIQISLPAADDVFSHPASPNVSTELPARSIGTRSQQQRPREWVEVRVLTGIDFAREELEYEYVMVDRQSLSVTT